MKNVNGRANEIPRKGGHSPHPVEIIEGEASSGVLILCDHASNAVPVDLASLGLPPGEFERHIAYDIGAAIITRRLAAIMNAPAILTTFSRLVIDPNRGRDDPTLVMRLSDGTVIPGNRFIDDAGVAERIARFYDPYDEAITKAIAEGEAIGRPPIILAIHSFTPVWRGWPRPWQIGVLWDVDDRIATPLIGALRADGMTVGDNEPYDGALDGDTVNRHATCRGLANALIEVRQDLVEREDDAIRWADRLAPILQPIVQCAACRQVKRYPTRARLYAEIRR